MNNHYAKFEYIGMKTVGYRLHKLGTQKVLRTDERTDGQNGPTIRPAFANVQFQTQ